MVSETKMFYYRTKEKAKKSHNIHVEVQGERRYSSYSFMTSALYGVSGQRHAPAAFCPWGKDPQYPLDCRTIVKY
jgi:hypothetical protein